LSKFSVDRETKIISVILFATFLSLVGAYYLDRQYFVDWSDVEKTAEYDRVAVLGDTIQISYYFVNPESHDIKVEPRNSFGLSIYYASKPEERITAHVTVNRVEKFITVPAMSEKAIHTETVTATQLGTLHVQVTGLPEAKTLVLPEDYNYTPWHSEPPSPWDGAELLPVEAVVNDWRDKGMNVYLPQYLPNNIEPLGARIQVTDEGLASSAVFVFSAYNRSKTGTAEITIGVREGVSSFENHTSWGMHIYSYPVSACIELPVEVRCSAYLELYGPYSTWVQMQIDSMYYWMRVEPSILLDDIRKIITSMTCVPLASETPFNVVIELNKYVFGSQDTAKLIITNKDSHLITFGSSYEIEKQVEGEWVEVSPFPWGFAWTSECRVLPAWETRRENIKIDHLESGHYRVSKTINHERTHTELTFTLEFDIVGLTTYDNVTLVDDERLIEIIMGTYDFREFLDSGRLDYVAVSPSDRDIVNVTIILGEIVEGKNAEMMHGYEVGDSMTSSVRYFNVKRYDLRGDPSRLIGERHGWIDQLGRCYVYDGWDELSNT